MPARYFRNGSGLGSGSLAYRGGGKRDWPLAMSEHDVHGQEAQGGGRVMEIKHEFIQQRLDDA
jgi:hypothetical protein